MRTKPMCAELKFRVGGFYLDTHHSALKFNEGLDVEIAIANHTTAQYPPSERSKQAPFVTSFTCAPKLEVVAQDPMD